MLYQYENRPFQLLITTKRKGVVTLKLYAPTEQWTRYLHKDNTSKVIGIVWGLVDGQTCPVNLGPSNILDLSGITVASNLFPLVQIIT